MAGRNSKKKSYVLRVEKDYIRYNVWSVKKLQEEVLKKKDPSKDIQRCQLLIERQKKRRLAEKCTPKKEPEFYKFYLNDTRYVPKKGSQKYLTVPHYNSRELGEGNEVERLDRDFNKMTCRTGYPDEITEKQGVMREDSPEVFSTTFKNDCKIHGTSFGRKIDREVQTPNFTDREVQTLNFSDKGVQTEIISKSPFGLNNQHDKHPWWLSVECNLEPTSASTDEQYVPWSIRRYCFDLIMKKGAKTPSIQCRFCGDIVEEAFNTACCRSTYCRNCVDFTIEVIKGKCAFCKRNISSY